MSKFVFIVGGVASSLGKGVVSASLACLLGRRGVRLAMIKMDPYLNADPGTMNPHQHGEVFVTEDGAETDLDLGHYERFSGLTMDARSSTTSGKIYREVLDAERRGEYGGGTVQVVPHVTNRIKAAFAALEGPDIDLVLVELGGTVGDIEGMPYIEAFRQFSLERTRGDCAFLHLALVPFLPSSRELKTKPAQHSVQKLREYGIQPDFLICRSEHPIPPESRTKLALFCNLRPECVIEMLDVPNTIYEAPLLLREQNLDGLLCRRLGIEARDIDLGGWRALVDAAIHPEGEVEIAVVGKYAELVDSYKSVFEALAHAGLALRLHVRIRRIDAETLSRPDGLSVLEGARGILIPGGFGYRGAEGKMLAIRRAREKGIPFLGLCYGLQCAVIEYARNVLGRADAASGEWAEELGAVRPENLFITLMDEQRRVTQVGGTMRLGSYPCLLAPDSGLRRIYGGAERVTERHRHRYEVNPEKVAELERGGMRFSGVNPDSGLVEMLELPDHPCFLATQAHPEFKSRPDRPHPLFLAFVAAAAGKDAPT